MICVITQNVEFNYEVINLIHITIFMLYIAYSIPLSSVNEVGLCNYTYIE